jgi:hypothetical protein
MVGAVLLSLLSLSSWRWMIRKIQERTRAEADWAIYTKWIIWPPIMILFIVVVMIIFQVVFQQPT